MKLTEKQIFIFAILAYAVWYVWKVRKVTAGPNGAPQSAIQKSNDAFLATFDPLAGDE